MRDLMRSPCFSPVQIRLRLERVQDSVPIDEDRYALLSRLAAHVHPGTRPQAHNILGAPIVGAVFQPEGLLVGINELAIPLVYVTAFAARLLDFDRDIDRRVMAAVLALARQIGGATITSVEDYRTQVRENVENATQIAELAAAWRRVRGRKRPKALRLSRVLPWRPRSMRRRPT
jgi:hypothetical protein